MPLRNTRFISVQQDPRQTNNLIYNVYTCHLFQRPTQMGSFRKVSFRQLSYLDAPHQKCPCRSPSPQYSYISLYIIYIYPTQISTATSTGNTRDTRTFENNKRLAGFAIFCGSIFPLYWTPGTTSSQILQMDSDRWSWFHGLWNRARYKECITPIKSVVNIYIYTNTVSYDHLLLLSYCVNNMEK